MANNHRHHPHTVDGDEDDIEGRANATGVSPLVLLWRSLRSLDIAVFQGNGEPGLLSRVTALESEMAGVKKAVVRMERVEWGILLAIVSTLIAVLIKR